MSKLYGANAYVLAPASPQAAAISKLFVGTLIFLAAILILVTFLVLFAVVRYRDRPGAPEARQSFGSRRLELIWTAGPIASLIVLAIFTGFVMQSGDPTGRATHPDVLIIAHQWWWQITYLKSGVTTANELHLPVGKPLEAELRSADVIHDFWVPELARKIDIVPGHPNHLLLEADHAGTYLGACAEFCGNEHAWMRIRVLAEAPAQFQQWLVAQNAVPAPPTAPEARAGAQLFASRSCANCHTVAGTPANQTIGPDLTHLASRETIAAGAAANDPANLLAWLHNPSQFKPGSHMPDLRLKPQELKELTAYLETLK